MAILIISTPAPTSRPRFLRLLRLRSVASSLSSTGQYAGEFGRTPAEAMLQAMQGVAIGLAAMMLPSVAAVLRRTGQAGWSRIAWAIWPGFLVLSVLAAMGFSARGLSDTLAGRGASIQQALIGADTAQPIFCGSDELMMANCKKLTSTGMVAHMKPAYLSFSRPRTTKYRAFGIT